jgi:hypothetical protein
MDKGGTEHPQFLGLAVYLDDLAGWSRRSVLGLKHWNREMELRTLAYFTLDPDAAAMSLDEMLGDGEAKAGAADFAGPRNIDPVEALKDAGLIHFGDADSRVRNRELDFFPVG